MYQAFFWRRWGRGDDEPLSNGNVAWVINAISCNQQIDCDVELLGNAIKRIVWLNDVDCGFRRLP
jgi:hypothetical protein